MPQQLLSMHGPIIIVNWEEAKVLHVCDRWHERCLLESWHMLNHPERMNRDKGILPDIPLSCTTH